MLHPPAATRSISTTLQCLTRQRLLLRCVFPDSRLEVVLSRFPRWRSRFFCPSLLRRYTNPPVLSSCRRAGTPDITSEQLGEPVTPASQCVLKVSVLLFSRKSIKLEASEAISQVIHSGSTEATFCVKSAASFASRSDESNLKSEVAVEWVKEPQSRRAVSMTM